MLDTGTLTVFIASTLALLVVPGPAVLFIVGRSLEGGRWMGVVSALGVALGSLCHVAFAAFGLSAVLTQSAVALSVVKYAGAAYLIYLGVKALLEKTEAPTDLRATPSTPRQVLLEGAMVNLLNPKTALFFFAFLPQFIAPGPPPVALQMLALGLIFTVLGVINDSIYGLVAGSAVKLIRGNLKLAKIQKRLAAITYLALGVATAVYRVQ